MGIRFHVTGLNKNMLLTARSNNKDDNAGAVKQDSAPLHHEAIAGHVKRMYEEEFIYCEVLAKESTKVNKIIHVKTLTRC